MTYKEFKELCKKSNEGKKVFKEWMNNKIPLTWAMCLIEIYETNL